MDTRKGRLTWLGESGFWKFSKGKVTRSIIIDANQLDMFEHLY